MNTLVQQTLLEISALIKHRQALSEKVAKLDQQLQDAKTEFTRYDSEIIPDLFMQLGLSELKLDSGEKVTIKRGYYGNISEERAIEAFKWLEDNGHGSLIKTSLAMTFGKGKEEQWGLLAAKAALKEQKVDFKEKKGVHPQTLKAFIKQQLEDATPNFPKELFGVHVANTTSVNVATN